MVRVAPWRSGRSALRAPPPLCASRPVDTAASFARGASQAAATSAVRPVLQLSMLSGCRCTPQHERQRRGPVVAPLPPLAPSGDATPYLNRCRVPAPPCAALGPPTPGGNALRVRPLFLTRPAPACDVRGVALADQPTTRGSRPLGNGTWSLGPSDWDMWRVLRSRAQGPPHLAKAREAAPPFPPPLLPSLAASRPWHVACGTCLPAATTSPRLSRSRAARTPPSGPHSAGPGAHGARIPGPGGIVV